MSNPSVRNNSSSPLVVAFLAVVAGLGYYGLRHRRSSRRKESDRPPFQLTDLDNDDTTDHTEETKEMEDWITEDEVTQLFDRLFLEMQSIFQQLMMQIQQLQMAGQRIPERQLQLVVRQEMERALQAKQTALLQEFNMDYDCLEEATWEFLAQETMHPAVAKAVDRFQQFWETATGEPVAGWRPASAKNNHNTTTVVAPVPLGPEQTIALAEQYFAALTDQMRTLVTQFKAQGRNLREAATQQALHLEFARTASDAGEAALAQLGSSQKQFEASIQHNADDPAVGRALAMLQMKQQQDLMAMGED